jgi:signal transduction histidine kinase
MISDRNEFMSWELKDDTLDDPYLAGGIAIYSNIRSLARSYAIIFDNLWMITELAEKLRITNIKLEGNEKAMKEFINIAAHDLRTPIQPILGLSEVIRDRTLNLAKQLQSRGEEVVVYGQLKNVDTAASSIEEIVVMVDVLNKNAKGLRN